MGGYASPILIENFDHLAEDGDTIWVAIRNPMLQSLDNIQPEAVPTDDNGKPLDPKAATRSMYKTIAGLVVAWKVYTVDGQDVSVDEAGNPVIGDPIPLPGVSREHPATADMVAQLPMVIINALAGKVKDGLNPPS